MSSGPPVQPPGGREKRSAAPVPRGATGSGGLPPTRKPDRVSERLGAKRASASEKAAAASERALSASDRSVDGWDSPAGRHAVYRELCAQGGQQHV